MTDDKLKPCPTKAEIVEAFDMTRRLIQEAKPLEGYITDHLDAAENWLDNLEEMFERLRATDTQVSALERIAAGRLVKPAHEDVGCLCKDAANCHKSTQTN